ncbi:MAG: hypothetical protein ISS57_17610 [Anaerolineales bacterium]|nr:hypothetical protein [Anaerolineales bacterium]
MNHIGELNEQPLHAALKAWYTRPGDQIEASVDGGQRGYVIDIVRDDDLLIEIQTGNFSSIKRKLHDLVKRHPVRLIYPIAVEKWLLKLPKKGWDGPRRRKSPKRGRVEVVFAELVSFPQLLLEDNFSLEVVLIQEEEVRRYAGAKHWRKKGWVTVERRLLDVVAQRLFETPSDMSALLPVETPQQFTTLDLAEMLASPRWLAQKMAYCLQEMGEIIRVGKRGRSYLYSRIDAVEEF